MASRVMKVVVGDTEPTRRYVGQVWLDLSVPTAPLLRICVDVDESAEGDRWVNMLDVASAATAYALEDHTHT